MRNTAVLFLTILLMCSGCEQNSLKQQLVLIDSIANKEGTQKSLEMLRQIDPEAIENEECLAYYWLLRFRAEINSIKAIRSVKPLEITISYYEEHKDKIKLAKAYCYKGYVLNQQEKLQEAIISLKKAEALIKDDHDNAELADYIYSSLSHINYKAEEKRSAIEYAKKALKMAYRTKKKYNIAYDLMILFIDYNDNVNKDSAIYYRDKCIDLLEHIPVQERSEYYTNIGNSYIDSDIKQAQYYLDKSISIKPNSFAYKGLARIYYIKGERAKAEEMWEKALQTDNLYLKAEILQARYECLQEEEDYKTACQTAMQIAAVKDSIAKKQHEEDIRGLQERFEQDQKARAERQRFISYIFAAISLLFLFLAATLYLSYRNVKGKKLHEETKEMLEKYRNKLKAMQQEGKADSKEVERLTQKISDLQKKQNTLLQNGREKYEEIMAGGTTLRWSRDDFTDCVEYYRTIDAAFVTHMETDYKQLSTKYIFFAIMEHIGKDDEQLQQIMVISQSTIRSIRSRMNKKLIIKE